MTMIFTGVGSDKTDLTHTAMTKRAKFNLLEHGCGEQVYIANPLIKTARFPFCTLADGVRHVRSNMLQYRWLGFMAASNDQMVPTYWRSIYAITEERKTQLKEMERVGIAAHIGETSIGVILLLLKGSTNADAVMTEFILGRHSTSLIDLPIATCPLRPGL